MQKITFLSLLLLFSITVIAQDMSKEQFNSLSDANKILYTRLSNDHMQRESRVSAYLLSNNAKRTYTNEKGEFFYMRDVVNGEPIYFTTNNANAAVATKTNQLQVGGALGLDLDGTGRIVGVWDEGPAQSTHSEFADSSSGSRVLILDSGNLTETGPFNSHGTHVSGTIAAKGVDPAAKGMATNVNIRNYNFANDTAEMLTAVTDAANPIYLSNHSYGVPASFYVTSNEKWEIGGYYNDARNIDELLFNNPKFLAIYSAGNEGNYSYTGQKFSGLDKLTGDKTGKNNLVIANANPNVVNGNLNLVINSSSSQGPTDDLRVKPDIAADGTNLYSPTPGDTYSVFTGTSMAAPNTTGTLVLLQQYYSQLNGGADINSATLKAIVCHTAVDDPAKAGPDPRFGWGFLDAKASAEVIGGATTGSAVLDELTLNNNDTYSFTFMADAGSKLSATICWTDVPGAVSSGILNDPTPALINDLDLRITKDGSTFLPWRISTTPIGALTNSKGDNNVDNVERIDIETPSAGQYTVTVSHKGSLHGGSSQNYSLVVTGSNLTLGVDDDNQVRGLMVFPNPNNGEFTISFKANTSSDVKLDIYDISGRSVYQNSFMNTSQQFNKIIDLKGLQSGVYIATISEGSRITSHKIVIN